ncbi:plasmid mobilization protein [Enterococcus sp. LJL98]
MAKKQKEYEKNRKNSEALYFRVDKKTYSELTKIAVQRGKSRSDICRERLQGLIYEPPLFCAEDTKSIIRGLNEVGNNLNQATKGINMIVRYYQSESERKKHESPNFRIGMKRYDIFQDERANNIARVLGIEDADSIFVEKNREHFLIQKLSVEERQVFDHWLERQKRPMRKEEYLRWIDQSLMKALEMLKAVEQDSEKLWALV